MLPVKDRKVSNRTPIYDHAGELLFFASREKAEQLIAQSKVEVLGNRVRIRGLRLYGPDPSALLGGQVPAPLRVRHGSPA
jgi:hypothetical protein